MNKPKLLITGATGFVGKALVDCLQQEDCFRLSLAVRTNLPFQFKNMEVHQVATISGNSCWANVIHEVDTVIHCAARAHVMNDHSTDPLKAFQEINVGGTLNLARQAALQGVRRFIFISSIKVNGESTAFERPYHADNVPAPEDPYGLSKLEAEQGLQQLAAATGLEVVIIRPPLVYGRGVKGNFASLIKLIEMGVPLPLGAIHNKRSLVGIDNLVDLIIRCINHPAAANQVFLAGDGEDLSTTQLLRGVAKAMGRPSRLIPAPVSLLQLGASLLGKKALAQRLLGSLQVDITKTRELLDWTPPVSVDEGLKRCFSVGRTNP